MNYYIIVLEGDGYKRILTETQDRAAAHDEFYSIVKSGLYSQIELHSSVGVLLKHNTFRFDKNKPRR